jgi:type VI secretion system protein ImpA
MEGPVSAATPIDITALTAPLDVPGETGPDLRFDPGYKAIGEARREENAGLPQGIWARDIKRADWPAVERLCTQILRDRSKDLQVACWLAEALVHRIGYGGLAPGLQLLTALCRRFWPNLHPAIDAGDLGPRLAPFEWINARFPALLRNLPVVRSASNPEQTYTMTDYVNAQLLEGLRQRDAKSVERSEAAGAVSLAAFVAVRERTDSGFWEDNRAALQAATAALEALNQTLEAACGREAPGLGAIGNAISDVLGLTAAALSERRPKPPRRLHRADVAAQAQAADRPAVAVPAPAPAPTAARSREEAYAQLAGIADLLHRLEPHSPVPHLIDCAVAWGEMSLPELLMTFADCGFDAAQVFALLGLAGMAEFSPDTEPGDREG